MLINDPTLNEDPEIVVEEVSRIVAPLFQVEGWEYGSIDSIPDADYIADVIFNLYCGMLEDPNLVSIATGRFTVSRSEHGFDIKLDLGTILDDGASNFDLS